MANNDDVRWRQRFEHLDRACDRLIEATDILDPSDLERTGLIKLYEMAFELSWKTLKDLLNFEGFEDVVSPKAMLRTAHEAGWIDAIDVWLRMLDARNRASHVYDESEAVSLVADIGDAYVAELATLRDRLAARLRTDTENESNERPDGH